MPQEITDLPHTIENLPQLFAILTRLVGKPLDAPVDTIMLHSSTNITVQNNDKIYPKLSPILHATLLTWLENFCAALLTSETLRLCPAGTTPSAARVGMLTGGVVRFELLYRRLLLVLKTTRPDVQRLTRDSLNAVAALTGELPGLNLRLAYLHGGDDYDTDPDLEY